jgi:CMP-N-acetylneuraminic acid synthetase
VKTLLVICARRGSARLRLKHHKLIAGKPLWRYAVDAAVKVKGALAVFSSDDMRIKREIQKCMWDDGEEYIPWITRPDLMANATAPIHLTLQHAVKTMEGFGRKFDVVGFIPANVPTITTKLIRECVRRMGDKRLTGIMTIRDVHDKPEWMWELGPLYFDPLRPSFPALRDGAYREQDLPRRYVATGTVNLVRTEVLMACTSYKAFEWLGPMIGGVLHNDAIEIHTKRDYEMAKAWMEAKK